MIDLLDLLIETYDEWLMNSDTLTLEEDDYMRMLGALENLPEPNDKLLEAVRDYEKNVNRGE